MTAKFKRIAETAAKKRRRVFIWAALVWCSVVFQLALHPTDQTEKQRTQQKEVHENQAKILSHLED